MSVNAAWLTGCAWVRPESASRLRHSRTAATTSLLPVPGERSIAARGEAAPASSSSRESALNQTET